MYVSGASDVDEQALSVVAADVAIFAVPSNDATWEYVPRLLEALARPRLVIPVHWDDFESAPTPPADGLGEQSATTRGGGAGRAPLLTSQPGRGAGLPHRPRPAVIGGHLAGQASEIWSPSTLNATSASPEVAGPPCTEPSSIENSLPWQPHLISPSSTEETTQPWCVQMAV